MFRCARTEPGARYILFMRLTAHLKQQSLFLKPLFLVSKLLLQHYSYKFGISIPYNTRIGRGLYIGHFGGIVVHPGVVIGKNCNINHGVTLGATYGGKNPGIPTILDNVYLGPGCKVIGRVTVGNNVAVGANCVVTSSVPDRAVIVGVPGKVKSFNGAHNYVVNTI